MDDYYNPYKASKFSKFINFMFLNIPAKMFVLAAAFIVGLLGAMGEDILNPEPTKTGKEKLVQVKSECLDLEYEKKNNVYSVVCYKESK